VAIGACAVLVAAGAAQLLVTSATTEAVTSAEHMPNARMARLNARPGQWAAECSGEPEAKWITRS